MCSATVLSASRSFQSIEEKLREQLKEMKRTSFGSEYVAFYASRDEVIALAESDLVNAFRRVVLDPVHGLVMLMSPSRKHEDISGDLDRFVGCAATLKGLKAKMLRATRWRREQDPKNTGIEADCSFYFGQRAVGYARACARSEDEADAYSLTVAPDLVVEVGLTHVSKKKYLSYRDKGVVEFWQLNTRPRKGGVSKVMASFLDLQAQSGPLEIETSLNLPGITPAHIISFIHLQTGKLLNHYEVIEAVRSLLEDGNGGMMIREEAEEYELAS